MQSRHIILSFCAALMVAIVPIPGLAQSEAAPVGKVQAADTESRKQDNQLVKDLNLTPEQEAHFKKTDEEFRAKNKAARSAKKQEATQLREERIKAHKSVLTPEQAAKYDEIVAKKKIKHDKRQKRKASHKAAKQERKAEKKALREELKKQ
jgi:Spy/CpxP family protein refolding chaperone